MKALSLLLVLGMAQPAHSFSWNGESSKSIIDQIGNASAPLLDTETIKAGGHPLATRRAVILAARKAKKRGLEQSVMNTFGEPLENFELEEGFFLQKLIQGNYLNELQTAADQNDFKKALLTFVLKHLRSYRVVSENNRSRFFEPRIGGTSSYHIHSMLVEDPSLDPLAQQEATKKKLEEFATNQLKDAMRLLLKARKAEEEGFAILPKEGEQRKRAYARYVKNRFKYEGEKGRLFKKFWYEFALRDLGSLFHMIQDSAVTCTESEKGLLALTGDDCLPGDGHGLVRWNKDKNRAEVYAFSSHAWYAREGQMHGALDDLYIPKNLASIDELLTTGGEGLGPYQSFDPAIAVSEILLEIAERTDKIYSAHKEQHPNVFARKWLDKIVVILGKLAYEEEPFSEKGEAWASAIEADIKIAAEEIVAKHVMSRYADKMEVLPEVPKPQSHVHDRAEKPEGIEHFAN